MDIHYLADHRDAMPILAAWIYNEWSYLYPGTTLMDFEVLFRERTNKNELPLTLVAIEAGEPIGTATLKAYDMETRNDLTPWLTSLHVVEPWRRRGIGSSLVKAIEQKAAELGIGKLYLFTTVDAHVDPFYKRLGWRVKERTRYHMHPVILMEKDLR